MKTIGLILMIMLVFAIIQTVSAQDTMRSATIMRVVGMADVMPAHGSWTEAKKGITLHEGSAVRTKTGSKVILSLDGREETAIVEIKGDTILTLSELPLAEGRDRHTLLDLAIGDILVKVKKLPSDMSKFEIRTPISYVGVRGTIFSVSLRRAE